MALPSINDKNLDDEIETSHYGVVVSSWSPINDKNLDYEIETGRVIIEFADSDWCDQ